LQIKMPRLRSSVTVICPYMGTSMSRTENVQQTPLSLAVSGPVRWGSMDS
jgi:hypothetical protein